MHPLLILALAPMLAIPGLGDPGVGLEPTHPVEPGLAEANATVSAEAGDVGVDVSADDTGLFLRAALPGPGISHPVEDVSAGVSSPIDPGESESSDAEARPVPLPEPEQTAVPAGLAVLGAAAYAAFRWRYLIPGLMPLYSRLSKGDLLENETRARLVELIEENPGLSQQELCDEVGAGWGNTVYHLQRLEQADFIRSEKQGHHRRFYRVGEMETGEIEALGVLKNDNANKIARYLLQEPGCNQKQVCQALDISPSLAHKWISRLEENDLVTSEREWRSKHYTPDERLDQLVDAV